jgi:(2R)-3-sulfolactate dehydrogenase (NADP+)
MMLPAGGVKGAMLALVVELLCCALTGAAFGFEADSFLAEDGNRPRIGQAFIVVDPGALAGDEAFHQRLELLVQTMLLDDQVRLPGTRRQQAAAASKARGIEVAPAMLAQLQALASA